MPENFVNGDNVVATTPPGANLFGSTFGQRREDIFNRLQQSSEQCKLKYYGRRELATEKDDIVLDLCEALEDAFSYGLRLQQGTVLMTAASLFQNVQEIVIGNMGFASSSPNGTSNDITFWDFCQAHLIPHERDRFEQLKHVWTKCGRGKAFIRAALNENSLKRYLLMWLDGDEELRQYYTPWSLFINAEARIQLPLIIDKLDEILFALTVDSTELNVAARTITAQTAKEEPIIHAPLPPAPAESAKNKRRTNIVERPIVSANSNESIINSIKDLKLAAPLESFHEVEGNDEYVAEEIFCTPPDPIEPELEFLKEPLPDFYPSISTDLNASNDNSNGNSNSNCSSSGVEPDYEDKSDTSSQYSKSSSANCSTNQNALEEKLQEMRQHCEFLETRVQKLSLENRQLLRRLTQHFQRSGIDPSSSLATNFLITIPQVKLLKSGHGSAYYAYEIHITMRQHLEHWTLWRRYREFYKLHKTLLRTHPSVAVVHFPPKKHFGNMNLVFVEERRQQLQIYLLNLVETLPQIEVCKSKAELQKVFPFLRER